LIKQHADDMLQDTEKKFEQAYSAQRGTESEVCLAWVWQVPQQHSRDSAVTVSTFIWHPN